MNKKGGILKIFFMAILLVFILGVIVGVITYIQLQPLIETMNDNSTASDLNALMTGNCSKLPAIEIKVSELKSDLKYPCTNLIVKWVITKNSPENKNPCIEFIDEKSETLTLLNKFREHCANQTNSTG